MKSHVCIIVLLLLAGGVFGGERLEYREAMDWLSEDVGNAVSELSAVAAGISDCFSSSLETAPLMLLPSAYDSPSNPKSQLNENVRAFEGYNASDLGQAGNDIVSGWNHANDAKRKQVELVANCAILDVGKCASATKDILGELASANLDAGNAMSSMQEKIYYDIDDLDRRGVNQYNYEGQAYVEYKEAVDGIKSASSVPRPKWGFIPVSIDACELIDSLGGRVPFNHFIGFSSGQGIKELIEIDWHLVRAKRIMGRDYSSAEKAAGQSIGNLSERMGGLERDSLCRVTTADIETIYGSGAPSGARGLDALCSEVESLKDGADAEYLAAKELRGHSEEAGYLARATIQMRAVHGMSEGALAKAGEIEDYGQGLVAQGSRGCDEWRQRMQQKAGGMDWLSAHIYGKAESMCKDAGNAEKTGEKIRKYAQAMEEFESLECLFDSASGCAERNTENAGVALDYITKLLDNAEADGLNVEWERQEYKALRLEYDGLGTDSETLFHLHQVMQINERAKAVIESVVAKARQRYGGLEQEREAIMLMLQKASYLKGKQEYRDQLAKFTLHEQHFTPLGYEGAIGSLKKMEQDYAAIRSYLINDVGYSNMIQMYVSYQFDETPSCNRLVETNYTVVVLNPYNIGVEWPVTLEAQALEPWYMLEAEDGVAADYSGGMLEITLDGMPARSRREIVVGSETMPIVCEDEVVTGSRISGGRLFVEKKREYTLGANISEAIVDFGTGEGAVVVRASAGTIHEEYYTEGGVLVKLLNPGDGGTVVLSYGQESPLYIGVGDAYPLGNGRWELPVNIVSDDYYTGASVAVQLPVGANRAEFSGKSELYGSTIMLSGLELVPSDNYFSVSYSLDSPGDSAALAIEALLSSLGQVSGHREFLGEEVALSHEIDALVERYGVGDYEAVLARAPAIQSRIGSLIAKIAQIDGQRGKALEQQAQCGELLGRVEAQRKAVEELGIGFEELDRARQHFERGVSLLESGDHRGALTQFGEARRLLRKIDGAGIYSKLMPMKRDTGARVDKAMKTAKKLSAFGRAAGGAAELDADWKRAKDAFSRRDYNLFATTLRKVQNALDTLEPKYAAELADLAEEVRREYFLSGLRGAEDALQLLERAGDTSTDVESPLPPQGKADSFGKRLDKLKAEKAELLTVIGSDDIGAIRPERFFGLEEDLALARQDMKGETSTLMHRAKGEIAALSEKVGAGQAATEYLTLAEGEYEAGYYTRAYIYAHAGLREAMVEESSGMTGLAVERVGIVLMIVPLALVGIYLKTRKKKPEKRGMRIPQRK